MAQSSPKNISTYKNENLFSRHYLKKVIQRTNIWEVDEDKMEDAFEELVSIYSEQKDFLQHRTDDEEEVRNEFITPVLRQVLDFKKEQEKKSGNSQRIPDYALYDTIEKKKKAVESQEYYNHAIGLVEAKAWKKDLEKKTSTGDMSTDDSNPTKQIVDYLIENDPQWGILTNGKKWRLVHREASNRLDTYYEIDLENLLTSEKPREEKLEEFKYFYIFFRKQAFQGDEGEKILDEILDESLQYAEEIGEDLEENIYQALEWLAKGYIENNSNDGIEDVPIEEIHDNSLIYLYRLLFALYADSRGILGDPGGKYEYYNFSELVDEVCEELDEGEGYGKSGLISNRLDAIFRMIDEGSQSQDIPKEELHIPAYNGGLFDQDKHEFLQKYNLHDKYLSKVIDLVARTEQEREGRKARADYYDLSVRHLGGIYEGLLEYQLEKADKDMVEVKENDHKKVKTVEEAEEDNDSFNEDDIIEKGQPYLVTDDGERKATGSYYTPDYIVKYIVENTVGTKVEEEIEGLKSDEEKAEVLLEMKILDPAMGSAHFLVEVIDYLATELVDYKEIEVDQAKREVARRCVYGVDVNPLATELGKLSIWLKTISEDKPLSFLDHHIKTGNSLIGADIHEINRHPKEDEDSKRQVTIGEEFGEENAGVVRANVQEMLKKFKEIQEKQADSPEDIKKQEELYQDFLDFPFRKRFDVLADVYTSHYFDNDYKVDDYNRLLQAFKLQEQKEEGDEEWNKIVKEDWVQKATDSLDDSHKEDNTSKEKGFFHWKLEFPEVFFDIEEGIEKETAGFDAVVGNPPYVKTHNLPDYYKQYSSEKFRVISNTDQPDIYQAFIERSIDLALDRNLSFIVPTLFYNGDQYEFFRKELLRNGLSKIVDCGDGVFDGVGMPTGIIEFSRKSNSFDVYVRDDKAFNYSKTTNYEFIRKNPSTQFAVFSNSKAEEVIEKLNIADKKVRDNFEWLRGLEMGKSSELLSEEKTETHNAPILTGEDVERYAAKSKKWLDEENASLKKERFFKEDKILIRETGSRLTALVERDGLYTTRSLYNFVSQNDDLNLDLAVAQLNSDLFQFYYKSIFKTRTQNFPKIRISQAKELPVLESERDIESKVDEITSKKESRALMNVNIRDYIGNYSEGKTLEDVYMPPDGISDTVLDDTKEDRENLKIGKVKFEESDETLVLHATAKYKPEDDEEFDEEEKDQWGYIETDFFPTMNFNVDEKMSHLIEEFVPIAVDNEEFGFKKKATKSTSIRGRLEGIQLPKLDDVSSGLDKFIKNKEKAQKLEREIQDTENEIDAIVFDLYDLTEEEVETVLDSLNTPERKKVSILEKFEKVI